VLGSGQGRTDVVTACSSEALDLFALENPLQEQVRAACPGSRNVHGAGEGLGASFQFGQLAGRVIFSLDIGTDIGLTADKVDWNMKLATKAGGVPSSTTFRQAESNNIQISIPTAVSVVETCPGRI